VTVVPVRVNANLKTATVQELEGQKRAMHLASFDYLLDELQRDIEKACEENGTEKRLVEEENNWLDFSVRYLQTSIVEQCREVYLRHAEASNNQYLVDEIYRSFVIEMIECKVHTFSKLHLWLDDAKQQLISLIGSEDTGIKLLPL
jgi:hypothetical protein